MTPEQRLTRLEESAADAFERVSRIDQRLAQLEIAWADFIAALEVVKKEERRKKR